MRLPHSIKLIKVALIASLSLELFSFTLPTYALEGDVIRPYVNVSYTYDDNVRRFSDKARALSLTGRENMADTVFVAGVGVIIDKKISRQGIFLDLNINETKYDRNSELNNTGKRFLGKWNWVFGNYWKGLLQFSHRERMVPFSDFNVNNVRGTSLSMVTEDSVGFDVIRKLHPRWQARLGIKKYELEYSAQLQRPADLNEMAEELALDYLAPSGDTVGMVYRHAIGDRPNPEMIGNLSVDNSYKEDSLKANMDWNITPKTRLRFLGGYVERKHDELSYRDFRGWNARANALWMITGKTTLNMEVWREANAQSFVTSTYTLNKGINTNLVWNATSKVALQGSYMYEQMEFVGEADREDIRKVARLSLLYKPKLDWQISTFLNHNTRSSNEDIYAFKSTSVGLSLRYEY